jgi:hypothetical protein
MNIYTTVHVVCKSVLLTVQMCLKCNGVGMGRVFCVMISGYCGVGGRGGGGGEKQVFNRRLRTHKIVVSH